MIVLAVEWRAHEGSESEVADLFRKLEAASRKEPGCLMYVGHQSIQNPRRFMFYEQYKDQAALDAHRNAPYFKQYVTDGLALLLEQRQADLYVAVE